MGTPSPTPGVCSAIKEADISEIENALHGHVDVDCLYEAIDDKDFIRAIPMAWCSKIHCDQCPSSTSCPNPTGNLDWSANKCHSENLNMLGFATRKQAEARHELDWFVPDGSMLEGFEASPGARVTFRWNGGHDVYLMESEEAYDSCDFSSATKLGLSSPVSYTIPSDSDLTPVYFACSVGSHCSNGQKLAVNVTSVNLTLAESYYKEALTLWPSNCGAIGYLSELYMTMGEHAMAISQLDELCSVCGASHSSGAHAIDMVGAVPSLALPSACISLSLDGELGASSVTYATFAT